MVGLTKAWIGNGSSSPTEIPINIAAWALAATKPTYTYSEVGAAASIHSHSGYASSSHNHSASNITSGTLPVARGGTGVTSLSALATALSSYMSSSGNIKSGYVETLRYDTLVTVGFKAKIVIAIGEEEIELLTPNGSFHMSTASPSAINVDVVVPDVSFSSSSENYYVTSTGFRLQDTMYYVYWVAFG